MSEKFWTAITERNIWTDDSERLEEVDSLEDGISLIENDYIEEDKMNGVDIGNCNVSYVVIDEDDKVLYRKDV